jgi:hypothetical protein
MGMEAKIDFSFPVAVAVIFFLIVMGIGLKLNVGERSCRR